MKSLQTKQSKNPPSENFVSPDAKKQNERSVPPQNESVARPPHNEPRIESVARTLKKQNETSVALSSSPLPPQNQPRTESVARRPHNQPRPEYVATTPRVTLFSSPLPPQNQARTESVVRPPQNQPPTESAARPPRVDNVHQRLLVDLHDPTACVDDTFIYGTLLSAKKSSNVTLYSKRQAFSGNKKARYNEDAKYDRYLLFRDTCSPHGDCFVIIFERGKDFSQFYATTKLVIGDVVRIAEPNPITNYVSDTYDLPVVKPNLIEECKVVNVRDEGVGVKLTRVKEPDAGKTLSFRLEKAKITMSGCKLVETVCRGLFCDKQETDKCSCMYNDKVCNTVVQARIIFDGGNEAVMFRSWRMTNLFVVSDRMTNLPHSVLKDESVRKKLRDTVQNIVNQVNDAGGWDILGWARTGEMIDVNDETSKVGSATIHPHIVWIAPSNSTAVFGKLEIE